MAARLKADPTYAPRGPWLVRLRDAPGEWAAFQAAAEPHHRAAGAGLGPIPTWAQMLHRILTTAGENGGIAWSHEGLDPNDSDKPSAATQERILGIRDDGATVPPLMEPLVWWVHHALALARDTRPPAHNPPRRFNPASTSRANPTTGREPPPHEAIPCTECRLPTDAACLVCSRCRNRYHRACIPPGTATTRTDSVWLCGACRPNDTTTSPEHGPDRDYPDNHGGGNEPGNRSGNGDSAGSTSNGERGQSRDTGRGPIPPASPNRTPRATAPPAAQHRPNASGPRPCDLLCQPPPGLARSVLAAAPSTTLHIPKSARAAAADFTEKALRSLAWQLADDSQRPEYNSVEVGFAIMCQSPARADYIRSRAKLLSKGLWEDAVRAVNQQKGAEAAGPRKKGGGRDTRNQDYFLQRANKCMQEGAVSKGIRALEAGDTAAAADPCPAAGWDSLFPSEDRPGLDPAVCPPIPAHPAHRTIRTTAHQAARSLPQAPRTPVRIWWEQQRPRRNTDEDQAGPDPTADLNGSPLFPASPDGALPAPDDRLMGEDAEEALRSMTPDPFWPFIARALARSSRMAAPGPSGLRSEHLGEVLGYKPLAGSIAAALTCVIDHYLDGRVPRSSADNRLFLLPKPNGGTRPIGARERLTSLSSRLAAGPLREELEGSASGSGQLGMSAAGTQRAAARIHDATRQGYHILSLDVKNAFNSISRRAVLHALPQESCARKLVVSLYDGPCYYRSAPPGPTIEATSGVVQGDPLAAMLFANAMAQVLVRAATKARLLSPPAVFTPCPPTGTSDTAPAPHGHWIAFADDVYIMSKSVKQAELFALALQRELLLVGLEVAKGKDKTAILRAPEGDDRAHRSAWMMEWVAEVDWLRCLGVPCAGLIGPSSEPTDAGKRAVCDEVNRKLGEVTRAVLNLRRLEHTQHILTALRLAGAWCRAEYLLSQVATWAYDDAAVETLAAADVAVLASALGPHGTRLTSSPPDGARAIVEATLPIRMGGFGIRWATDEIEPARRHTKALITALEQCHSQAAIKSSRLAAQQERSDATNRIATGMRLMATTDLARDLLPNATPVHGLTLDRVHPTLAHLARRAILEADNGIAGRLWGSVASPHNGTLLPGAEAATAAATRLGLPLFDGESRVQCPLPCATRGRLDAYGWHSAGCASVNATRERRAVAAAVACLGGSARYMAADSDAARLMHGTGYVVATQRRCGANGLPLPASAEHGVGVDGDLVIIAPGHTGADASRVTYLDYGCASLHPSDPMSWVHTAENGCQPGHAAHNPKWRAGQLRIVPTGAKCSPVAYTPLGHIDARSVRTLRAIASGVDSLDDMAPFGSEMPRSERIICATIAAIVGATAACVNRARETLHLTSKTTEIQPSDLAILVRKTISTRREYLTVASAAAA